MSEHDGKHAGQTGVGRDAQPQTQTPGAPGMLQSLVDRVGPAGAQRAIQRRLAQRRARTAEPGVAPSEAAADSGSPAAADPNGGADRVQAAAERGIRGAGGPLPHLDSIQRAFGRHDVSQIRAHTDGEAAAGAEAMGAEAFATGDHVAFGGATDLHTAAHEAAHVVQQRGGVQLKQAGGEAGDPYERHADEVADKVVRGGSAEPLLDEHAPAGGGGAGGATAPVQRRIKIAGQPVNQHTLAEELQLTGMVKDSAAWKALWPIALAFRCDGEHTAANYNALRTQLVEEYVKREVYAVAEKLPALKANLKPEQFNTIVFMIKLERYDAKPFESAVAAAVSSASVEKKGLERTLGSPGHLPPTPATFAIFATDFSAYVGGLIGMIGELQAASGIDPKGLSGKVEMSKEYGLGEGVTIGGQNSQDVDLNLQTASGQKVMVEVAASIDMLDSKLGAQGADQRARYERLAEINPGRALAYSVPGIKWHRFFRGERVNTLVGLDPPRGLIVDGLFRTADELTEMKTKLADAGAAAKKNEADFIDLLDRSGLGYDDVVKLGAVALYNRLRRHM